MKPTQEDLRFGLAVIGDAREVLSEVPRGVFEHQANIGLIHAVNGEDGIEWELTPAGEKLLPAIINGEGIPPLI